MPAASACSAPASEIPAPRPNFPRSVAIRRVSVRNFPAASARRPTASGFPAQRRDSPRERPEFSRSVSSQTASLRISRAEGARTASATACGRTASEILAQGPDFPRSVRLHGIRVRNLPAAAASRSSASACGASDSRFGRQRRTSLHQGSTDPRQHRAAVRQDRLCPGSVRRAGSGSTSAPPEEACGASDSCSGRLSPPPLRPDQTDLCRSRPDGRERRLSRAASAAALPTIAVEVQEWHPMSHAAARARGSPGTERRGSDWPNHGVESKFWPPPRTEGFYDLQAAPYPAPVAARSRRLQ
jgi:hypothetical protein